MYAEVCGYLTPQKYFDLPTYRVSNLILDWIFPRILEIFQKPLVNFTVLFCVVVFLGMCLVGVGVVTHADWK